jgi:transaldolase
MAMSILDQLKKMTTIVADTGDIDSIRVHLPRDATTNPSLLLAAAQKPEYAHLVDDALEHCSTDICDTSQNMRPCLERLAVNFAKEILDIIPGRVSVEADATLSFDTAGTIETAQRIISMFEQDGIDRSRILIKIASTWEGIRAAEQLTKEGIHCNLTLLFSFTQAVACAEAGVQLVSPFVGRIMDWYKADRGVESIPAEEDPGVHSVTEIYNYFKHFGYKTEIMGASFRNTGEIHQLAGCDLLTISPTLLEELAGQNGELPRKLDPDSARSMKLEKITLDENRFRWMLNEDAMATEKLAEGIRKFSADLDKLAQLMREKHCKQ